MKRVFLVLLVLGLILSFQVSQAQAGGGQSYPNGSEAFMAGALPPPGLYLDNYGYYYHGGDLKDDHKHNISAFDHLDVEAYVARVIWVSHKKILGGQYTQHFFLPVLHTDLKFNVPVGPEHKTSYHDTGIPYLIYNPFILGYHFMKGKFHLIITPGDIYIPVGQDDRNMASVGHNYWTFEPVVAFTFMPYGYKLAISAKVMYDFNTKQDNCPTVYGFEVDRDPGQEFHFDYSVSYGITPHLRFGVNGYYYTQTTDDDYHPDSNVPALVKALLDQDEGNHSEVFAIGPGIFYNYKNMFFSLRSQWEMASKNKTEGGNVWLKFIYKF